MEFLSYILEQTVNGLQLGAVYALIALGYTMVYGVLRLINFAHGDIFMFGAFTAYYLLTKWDLPIALVFPLTMAVTALLGFLIEKLAYKPLRTAPKISLLITAVGVSLFLEYFLSLDYLFTPNYIGFPRPFEVTHYNLSLLTVTNIQLIIFLATAFSLFWLYLLIYYTKYGRAMRALSHDPEAASLMGVPVDAIISLTFIVGAALAGLGGSSMPLPTLKSTSLWGSCPGSNRLSPPCWAASALSMVRSWAV